MDHFDLFIIGGGSAGMKAARTAIGLGKKVGLAEEREVGGECFWAGCVPTKAMVRAAEVWHGVSDLAKFGITVSHVKRDFQAAMAYKDRAQSEVGGEGPADGGLVKLGAAYFPFTAKFTTPHTLQVGPHTVSADRILIASGTSPFIPPIPGLLDSNFITNRETTTLKTLPNSLVVIGGGPIGLEFAQTFARFGSKVTVVERNKHILAQEDIDISALIEQRLRAEGVTLEIESQVAAIQHVDGGNQLTVKCAGKTKEIRAEAILVATGRTVNGAVLGLDLAGIKMNGRYIECSEFLQTSVPHIWTAGDVNGGPLFTHVASYEGGLVVRNMYSSDQKPIDYSVVPRITFVSPEVASVGETERAVAASGKSYQIHRSTYSSLDRAILFGNTNGFVKIISDTSTGLILGGQIVGEQASSTIAEIALAMRHGLPVSAISTTMHAYPSFPEAVESAALD